MQDDSGVLKETLFLEESGKKVGSGQLQSNQRGDSKLGYSTGQASGHGGCEDHGGETEVGGGSGMGFEGRFPSFWHLGIEVLCVHLHVLRPAGTCNS